MLKCVLYRDFWENSKPICRLQGKEWHDLLNRCFSYKLTKITKSDKGHFLGMYLIIDSDGSQKECFHWLNEEEQKQIEEKLNET